MVILNSYEDSFPLKVVGLMELDCLACESINLIKHSVLGIKMAAEQEHDSIRDELTNSILGLRLGRDEDENTIKEEEITISARGTLIKARGSIFNNVPLLETMLAERIPQTKDNFGHLCIDLDPKVLHACVSFGASGFGSPGLLLTKLSVSVEISELMTTADYLMIDMKTISSLKELKILELSLKDVKNETMWKVARHTYEPTGDTPDRHGARDASAELCFSLNKQTLNLNDNQIKSKITTDVLFVVSHAKTFGPRIRTHIWHEFQKVVSLTARQMRMFDEWVSDRGLKFDFNQYDDSDADSDHTDGDCSDGAISWGEDLSDY